MYNVNMQLYNHIARNIRYPSHVNVIFTEIVNHFNIEHIESTSVIVVSNPSLNYVKWEGYDIDHDAADPMYKPKDHFIESVELEKLSFMDGEHNIGTIHVVYIKELNKLYVMEN